MKNYIDLVPESPISAGVRSWTNGIPLEAQAIEQVKTAASVKHLYAGPIAIMPDGHLGRGCVVGAVVPTIAAIAPSMVGVDLGCGVSAMRTLFTSNDLPDLQLLYENLNKMIPTGFDRWSDKRKMPMLNAATWTSLLAQEFEWLKEKYPIIADEQRALDQLGTLGTGNHFVEICLDEEDRVWFMLHSGSRGIGNQIGQWFINGALDYCTQQGFILPNRDLAYLEEGTEMFADYVKAVAWAQRYAKKNRVCMMHQIMDAWWASFPGKPVLPIEHEMYIDCHHNYIAQETHDGVEMWVTRKGAVHAGEGELVIIPSNMATHSYIARGKGNPESYQSCSHGAGRRMSRSQGKKTVTLQEHAKDTEGIVCRLDSAVLDEAKANYKDIDQVMAAQQDLVEPIFRLKQIVNVKG